MMKKTIPTLSAITLAILISSQSGLAFANPGAPANTKEMTTNSFWWPQQLDLSPLRQDQAASSPYGADFDYVKQFNSLDVATVKAEIKTLLTTPQDWWPPDYGHYGPFMIRMAWHSAGVLSLIHI